MNYKILPYESFNFKTIKDEFPNESLLIIYDKKLHDNVSCECVDLNTFKFLTWKHHFYPKIHKKAIFLLKKIPDDFFYSFFRNSYSSVIIFSDDNEIIDQVFKKPRVNTKIILPPLKDSIVATDMIIEVYKLFLQFNENFIKTYVKLRNQKCDFFVLFDEKLAIPHFKSARECDNRAESICLVYNDQDGFKYSDFKESIFIAEQKRNLKNFDKSLLTPTAFKELQKIGNSCETLLVIDNGLKMEGRIQDLLNSNFEGFKLYVDQIIDKSKEIVEGELQQIKISENEMKPTILEDSMIKISLKTCLNSLDFQFLKVKESKIGKIILPTDSTRQFLEHVMLCFRKSFEEFSLFIRTILPKINYSQGGFCQKEFNATMSFAGIFSFEVTSDFFISKKEAINDASLKFLETLLKMKLIDENMNVNSDVLMKTKCIQKLLIKAFSTSDLDKIERIRIDFYQENAFKIVEKERIIERKGKVVLVKEDSKNAIFDLFKRTFMVDSDENNFNNLEIKEIAESNLTFNLNNNAPESSTMNKFINNFFDESSTQFQLEKWYRKIPSCLSIPTNVMSLYTFSNSSTGILCSESPFKQCSMYNELRESVQITYNPSRIFSEREIEALKFYQIIFFKMHCEILPSKKQTVLFHYYAVPLDMKMQIDWPYLFTLFDQFLQNFIYSDFETENLIWNPFTKEFLISQGKSDKCIDDKIGETTYLDFFQSRYRISLDIKSGEYLFRAFTCEDACSAIRKVFNMKHSAFAALEKPNNEVKFSICASHVNNEESLNLNNENESNILLEGINQASIDEALKNIQTISVYSAECCFITPVKKSILVEIELFKRNYKLIEDLFISIELNQAFDLNLDLIHIVQSFTQRRENQLENYERLEFLGDGVLKFLTTNFLFLTNYPLDRIVSFKDSVVCNTNLFKCCLESGIFRYLKTSQFNPKMVQAPCINDIDQLKSYFNSNGIHSSDNYMHFALKISNSDALSIKVYADMIEALIGSLYMHNGIEYAYKFICKLGILKPFASNCDDTVLTDNFLQSLFDQSEINKEDNKQIDVSKKRSSQSQVLFECKNTTNEESAKKLETLKNSGFAANFQTKITTLSSVFYGLNYTYYQFNGLINEHEISSVENIIGYRFINPGNLERAIVHPSLAAAAKLGCLDFQYLELIGDSSLDLFVNYLCFQNKSLNSPLLLHSAKKAYVNNISLRNLFYKFEFDKYSKLFVVNMPNSKAFSDVIEAIIGAILVDVQWDFNLFIKAMNVKIRGMLEECKSEFNLN